MAPRRPYTATPKFGVAVQLHFDTKVDSWAPYTIPRRKKWPRAAIFTKRRTLLFQVPLSRKFRGPGQPMHDRLKFRYEFVSKSV